MSHCGVRASGDSTGGDSGTAGFYGRTTQTDDRNLTAFHTLTVFSGKTPVLRNYNQAYKQTDISDMTKHTVKLLAKSYFTSYKKNPMKNTCKGRDPKQHLLKMLVRLIFPVGYVRWSVVQSSI